MPLSLARTASNGSNHICSSHTHARTHTHTSSRNRNLAHAQNCNCAKERARGWIRSTVFLFPLRIRTVFSPLSRSHPLCIAPSRSGSAREIWSSMTCCTRKPWQFYSSLSARICNNVHAKLSKFSQKHQNHKASGKLKYKR